MYFWKHAGTVVCCIWSHKPVTQKHDVGLVCDISPNVLYSYLAVSAHCNGSLEHPLAVSVGSYQEAVVHQTLDLGEIFLFLHAAISPS